MRVVVQLLPASPSLQGLRHARVFQLPHEAAQLARIPVYRATGARGVPGSRWHAVQCALLTLLLQAVCNDCADIRVGFDLRTKTDMDVARKLSFRATAEGGASAPAATASPIPTPSMSCSSSIISADGIRRIEGEALSREHR